MQVPFWFLDVSKLARKLNLFDDPAAVWRVATGEDPPPPRCPYDQLTSWVALACIGGIEKGGPGLQPELDREARLAIASEILTDEQLLVVETIAVPRRYRHMAALELEDMIRHAKSHSDRLWAACWLTLIGWTESRQCSFKDVSPASPMGEIDEAIRAAHARENGVLSARDLLGAARVGQTQAALLIHQRLGICQEHYALNGPPPYECVRHTIPANRGWRRVVRLVPGEER